MSKHQPEIVTTREIYACVPEDSIVDELLTEALDGQAPKLEQRWRVSWPDHVRVPKFDRDASYQPIDGS